MVASTPVSVSEYLGTTYHPDREYVDGVVIERSVGEKKHSKLQIRLGSLLLDGERRWNIDAYTEQRVQVRPDRYRVPDICVELAPGQNSPVITHPPFLCIEILSPDDRTIDTLEKIADYIDFGVQFVWVIDPYKRRSWTHTKQGFYEVSDRVLRTKNPDIEIALDPIWPELG